VSDKRSFIAFLVALAAPFVLVLIGAGVAGVGFTQGWWIVGVAGLVIAAAGVVWGLIFLSLNGGLDGLP